MTYILKGNSNGRGSKVRWPLVLIAKVIHLSQNGRSVVKAFAEAVTEYNATATTPIVLAASYTNKFAGSVLFGMKDRFQKKLEKGDAEAIAFAKQFNLLKSTDGSDGEAVTITAEDVGTLNV